MFTAGVFQDLAWAERGIAALLADGFPADALSVMAKSSSEVGAFIQATFGQAPVELTLPETGSVFASGPIVDELGGSSLETTGLFPAFGRVGFQRHDGYIYQTLIGRGGVLVAVLGDPRAADALAILHAYGGGNAAIGAWMGRV